MDYFSGLTQWLNNTTFYKEHISGWPEPLNNASFDICLFLFLILAFVIPDIVDRIKNYIAHKRIIRKNLAFEEQRADEKLSRKTETENNVLLDQYMKFMLIAQMQKTIEDQAKQNSALQIQLNEFVDDSEIKIRIAQMDNETKIFLKRLDLAAANEELQAKLQADFMVQQAKLQNEIIKKRMDLRKDIPVVPVFNEGRFV